VSAAADAATETKASSAQIAGFCTAVAAVQYLVLFQGGGRVLLSNGEEFGASSTSDVYSISAARLPHFADFDLSPTTFVLNCLCFAFGSVHCLH
jgi:hypothetical protein